MGAIHKIREAIFGVAEGVFDRIFCYDQFNPDDDGPVIMTRCKRGHIQAYQGPRTGFPEK